MRYYLLNNEENEEFIIDLIDHQRINKSLIEFSFRMDFENGEKIYEKVYIKKLAGRFFTSFDQKHWVKTPKQDFPESIVNYGKIYDLFRGYKRSGLGHSEQGALVSKMPGKVIEIKVKVGQKVKEGETLLIIEAMKMENEIKANQSGVIKCINVELNQTLDSGIQLLELE